MYIVIRSHCMAQRLLTRRDVEMLALGERRLSQYPEYSHVKESFSLESKLTLIAEKFVKRAEALARIPSPLSSFIKSYMLFLEIENLKVRLRAFYGRRGIVTYLNPYGQYIKPDEVKVLAGEEELWRAVKRAPYYYEPLLSLVGLSEAEKELYLEMMYYNYVRRKASKSGVASEVLKAFNAEAMSRLVYWILVLGQNRVSRLASGGLLGAYREYAEKGLGYLCSRLGVDESHIKWLGQRAEISAALVETGNAVADYEKRLARRMCFKQSYVYYYLKLCRYEMENLQKVVTGHLLGLSPKRILGSLITSCY